MKTATHVLKLSLETGQLYTFRPFSTSNAYKIVAYECKLYIFKK